jgi:hypothetical protein
MFAQVLEIIFPGEPYTSDGTTLDSVVFKNKLTNENVPNLNDAMKLNPDSLKKDFEFTLYTLQNADAIKKFREERNTRLNESDKYMIPDYPNRLEPDTQNWRDYRQALRELPITARPTLDEDGNLKDVVWPTIPTPFVPSVQPEEPE